MVHAPGKKLEFFSLPVEIPTVLTLLVKGVPGRGLPRPYPGPLFCQIVYSSRLFDCGRSKAFPYASFVVKEQLYANRFVADRNQQS